MSAHEEWNQLPKLDQLKHLKSLIEKNPWDHENRERFIQRAIKENDLDLVRSSFEEYLNRFPTQVRMWCKWVDFEWDQKDHYIEKVFEKSIPICPHPRLYQLYLDYILLMNVIEKTDSYETVQEKRSVVLKTFDYILNMIGTDKEAGSLWLKYIQYIKDYEPTSSFEEQQKMDQLRKVFHKAIVHPNHQMEEIWKLYDKFENDLNKLTAKKFISDRAAGYMTARGNIKTLENLLGPIEKIDAVWIAKPMLNAKSTQLVNYWKRYLSWEVMNPFHFEDRNTWISRVYYAYKSALLMTRHFPEIWYDCFQFLLSVEKLDEAVQMLQAGIDSNPTCVLLPFTMADHYQSRKMNYDLIQTLFDELLVRLENEYNNFNEKYDKEKLQLEQYLKDSMVLQDLQGEDPGEKRQRERDLEKNQEQEVEIRIEVPRKLKIKQLRETISLVWIMYMRIARTSNSARQARLVFSRARKSSFITSHVFVSSALMEYYVNKDPVVAGKIFEVGIKTFALDKDEYATQYVLHYIEFLTCLNDDNNTRALFERALSAIPSNQSEPIWKRYIQYETQYGDVSNLYKIEKRKSQISTLDVNSVESAETIAKKWCWYDLDIVGTFEIGLEALLLSSRLPAPVTSTKPLAREKKDDKGRSLASLGGVKDVDKYPKPELGRWNMYKPEPGMSRNMDIVTIKPVATKKPTAAQIQPSNTKPIGMLVPEPIAKMAALLPRRETYDGPIINVTELLALLLRLPLPVPLNNNIKMVPLPAGQGRSKRRNDDDDYSRPGKVYRGD